MHVSPSEAAALVAAAGAAGAGLLRVLDLMWGRASRAAAADKTRVETRATEQEIVAGEVKYLRDIIAEVRQSEAKKAERIDNLEHRLTLLEERERHMLTRAAVHEAWDQMAFAILPQVNPEHPPPPPLVAGHHDHEE